MQGSGGCYESTLASILSLVSKGFALESLCAIVMTGVVLLWHAWWVMQLDDGHTARRRHCQRRR